MKIESVVFSDALQGGQMLLMVQRIWRSTVEGLARELTSYWPSSSSRNGKSTGVQINAKYDDAPRIPFPDSDLEKLGPQVHDKTVALDRLVIPHGGEYFFTPQFRR
jgi:hypothetical protein